MPSNPTDPHLVLGFDTSGAYCAAALISNGTTVARQSEDMNRGQAEHLMPLLEDLLAQTGYRWQDLTALGVGVGPGNFTGIRISVSAARGLALALDIPAVGVTNFDATLWKHPQTAIPIIPAPRDHVYAALPNDGPTLIKKSDLDQLDAPLIVQPSPPDLAENIAYIAAQRANQNPPPAAPYYLRAADAAPPRDPAPVILYDTPVT